MRYAPVAEGIAGARACGESDAGTWDGIVFFLFFQKKWLFCLRVFEIFFIFAAFCSTRSLRTAGKQFPGPGQERRGMDSNFRAIH